MRDFVAEPYGPFSDLFQMTIFPSANNSARSKSPPHSAIRSLCGLTIGFRSNKPDLLAALLELVPAVSTRETFTAQLVFSLEEDQSLEVGPLYCFAVNGRTILRDRDVERIKYFVQRQMEEAIALLAPGLVLVHAGVVGWKGQALLLPGRSWSGKTSLVMALVDAGATYYSDEFAVIDEAGLVYPYLRTPHIREPLSMNTNLALLESIHRLPSELPAPIPIAALLFTRYCEQAVWAPQPLAHRELFFSLLENTVVVRSRPELTLRVLAAVTARANGFRTDRGDANAMAKTALNLISTSESISMR